MQRNKNRLRFLYKLRKSCSKRLNKLNFYWQYISFFLSKKSYSHLQNIFYLQKIRDESISLVNHLKSLNKVSFCPNWGNLGDFLIARATFQLFDNHHINYNIFDKNSFTKGDKPSDTFIYGGGGLFIHHYHDDYQWLKEVWKSPHIKNIIILPHSFYRCDDLVQHFDERFTIYCREKQSYNYLKKFNLKSTIILDHDLATSLTCISPPCIKNRTLPLIPKKQIFRLYRQVYLPLHDIYEKISKSINSSVYANKHGEKVGFLFRDDKESSFDKKITIFNKINNFDISNSGIGTPSNQNITQSIVIQFISAINYFDIIYTDRLHVAIAAVLLNKKVFVIDNDYKKLSNIVHNSFSNSEAITLINENDLINHLPVSKISGNYNSNISFHDFVMLWMNSNEQDFNPVFINN